jgi:hypothetical protein
MFRLVGNKTGEQCKNKQRNHSDIQDMLLLYLLYSVYFIRKDLTINVPVVYMGRYEVVLRGDYS